MKTKKFIIFLTIFTVFFAIGLVNFTSVSSNRERFISKVRIMENLSSSGVLENTSLTITSPNASSVWNPSNSPKIAWTSTGEITDVKLELYQEDNATLKKPIISSTPNDGEYRWNVDSVCDLAGLISSNKSQIKISSTSNSSIFDYSDYFEIKILESHNNKIPGYMMGLIVLSSSLVIGILFWIIKKNPQMSHA